MEKMKITDEDTIREYYDLRKQIETYSEDMKSVIQHPNYSLPFMQPGRLVRIKYQDMDFGWGAVVNFVERKFGKNDKPKDVTPQESYIIDTLLLVADTSSSATRSYQNMPSGIRPPAQGEKGQMQVVPCMLTCVDSIGHVRVILPKDLKPAEDRNHVKKVLDEVKRRFRMGCLFWTPSRTWALRTLRSKSFFGYVVVKDSKGLALIIGRKSRCSNLVYCRTRSITHHGCQSYMINTRKRSSSTTSRRLLNGRLQMRKLSCRWTN